MAHPYGQSCKDASDNGDLVITQIWHPGISTHSLRASEMQEPNEVDEGDEIEMTRAR